MKSSWKLHLAQMVLLLALAAIPSGAASGAESFQPAFGDPVLEPWRWRVFPELNGLGVQCMGEGKAGTIWFGTTEGAWSYDGLQWAAYGKTNGLPGSVDAFCTGPGGLIYAGGVWGVAWFTGKSWNRIWPLQKPGSPALKFFPVIKRLVMGRDGTLWAATSWGVLRHQGRDWVLYTGREGAALMERNPAYPAVRVEMLPDEILSKPHGTEELTNRFDFCEAYEDHLGRIWLGTEAGEVLCLKRFKPFAYSVRVPEGTDGWWSLYNESDGLSPNPRPRILQVVDGTIWVMGGGSPGRANQFDGKKWMSKPMEGTGTLVDCNSVLQTRDGVFWVGCNGAVAANREGHWQVYEAPKAPIPNARTILFQSSDGALWIAGQDAEVLRLDYQTPRWTTYQALNFQWESPKGAQWFLHRDGRVVVHDGNQWTSYGVEDGLIDSPTSILGTRNGDIWVAGSHNHTAASTRFDGAKWTRVLHDDLSWGVDWRCLFESSDGSVWLGAAAESAGPGTNYQYGLKMYRNGKWFHTTVRNYTVLPSQHGTNVFKYADPAVTPVGKYHGLGESRMDNKLWRVDTALSFFDGRKGGTIPFKQSSEIGAIETLFTSKEGELWVGSRQHGIFRYDGKEWRRYHVKEGLVANTIRGITQTADGSIWAATDRGVSRFDGRDWTCDVLPPVLNIPRDGGSLKAAPSGTLWLNRCPQNWSRRAWPQSAPFEPTNSEFWTLCFQMSQAAPQTTIAPASEQVPQPGNLTLSWKAADPWHATDDSRLQYSFRMDSGPWSRYNPERQHSFFSLPTGRHHVEVRARDDDFNVDPRPASLDFVVLPPVWRQAWFLGLLAVFAGIIAVQAARIISRGRHLRRTNRALAAEVEERKRIQAEVETAQKQLLEASRQAGMAEVATNVLHNVGNVLNSVNVSAELLVERVRKSRLDGLAKLAELVAEHAHEPNFLAEHEKGKMVPAYLKQLSGHVEAEKGETLKELGSLRQNIEHINEIVAKQQEYSRLAGFTESVKLTDLVEDALRLNEGAFADPQVQLVRECQENVAVVVEKHKVLQILVNLIRNAKNACDDSGSDGRQVGVRTSRATPDRVRIEVRDNGVGIAKENLTRIFNQGFTTRKTGHGFGLHGAANAAKEMGGSLTAQSDGPGRGAIFTLDFPIDNAKAAARAGNGNGSDSPGTRKAAQQ
jgi:signal transduction histidine kinase/ligand-binding sensor domain-containing protein